MKVTQLKRMIDVYGDIKISDAIKKWVDLLNALNVKVMALFNVNIMLTQATEIIGYE